MQIQYLSLSLSLLSPLIVSWSMKYHDIVLLDVCEHREILKFLPHFQFTLNLPPASRKVTHTTKFSWVRAFCISSSHNGALWVSWEEYLMQIELSVLHCVFLFIGYYNQIILFLADNSIEVLYRVPCQHSACWRRSCCRYLICWDLLRQISSHRSSRQIFQTTDSVLAVTL